MDRAEILHLVREDPQVVADAIAIVTAVLANHEGDDALRLTRIVEPATTSPERAAATLLFVATLTAPLLAELRAVGVDPNRWLERCATTHQAKRS